MNSTPAGRLDGRVALVTGASRGIGAATAERLAIAGARVTLAARDVAALEQLHDHLRSLVGEDRVLVVPTDVSVDAQVEEMVAQTVQRFGGLDIAVNNAAAHGARPTTLMAMPIEQFDRTLAVTLRGLFLCMRHEIAAMARGTAEPGGAIVNVASTAAVEGVGGLADYVAAKHAVVGLTRTAALDHASDGVRVNAVLPGPIHTESLERAGASMREQVARTLPLQRLGKPADVAQAITWLCQPEASFVTGVTLPVDGGRLAGTPAFARS